MLVRFTSPRRRNWTLAWLLAGSALAAITAGATPTFADTTATPTATDSASLSASGEPNAEVPDIVVTARRRNESVQRVPIAISTLSASQIEASGAYRLDQLKQLVPSVQTLTFNPRNANVSIRGLGGNVSLTNDGLEQGVGFYVDDVYYGRPGQSQFDLVDLQQVEVLRGPQGTLFGKNTTAGAINITTREPSSTFGGSFEASGGNYGFQQLRGSVTGPILDGKLAFRASIAGTHRDGNVHSLHDGRTLGGYDNLTTRVQLLATPNDNLRIRVIADYGVQRQDCCIGVVAGTVTTRIDGTPLPNAFAARAARIGYALPAIDPFSYNVDVDARVRTQMYTGGLSAKVDYDLGNLLFTSITAGRFWNWKPENDADGIGLPALYQARIIDHQRQVSQEFRLASKGEQKVDWVLGAYYFWQAVPGYTTLWYGPYAAQFNLPPALYPTPAKEALAAAALNDYQLFDYSRPDTKSYALFGQATWHATDHWELTGGLRYTREDKIGDFSQTVTRGADISTFAPADQPYVNTIRGLIGVANAYSVKTSESNVSGLVTANYSFTKDVLAYATWSKGYKSGGLNLSNLPAGVPKSVDPEEIDNYELGFKSNLLNHALTFNVAAFSTDTKGYQTNVFDPTLLTTYIANIGLVRSQGVELDLRYRPDGNLNLYASVAYDDARYVDYKNAPPPVEYTGLLPPTANFIDLSGKPLPGAPRWSASLGGEYARAVPGHDNYETYLGADYNLKSAYYASINDSPSSLIEGFGLLNLRLGLRTRTNTSDLSFWVRNAGQTKYFETLGGGNAGGSGLITGIPGQPRTWGLTYRHKFGG